MSAMWSRARFVLPHLLTGVLLWGCEDGDGDSDGGSRADAGSYEDGGVPADGGGGRDGGAAADAGGSATCVPRAELEELLPPTSLSGESVIYRMVLDGDHLYFSSLNTLYRIPKAGGEREQLWTAGDAAVHVPFFVRTGDLLVLRGRQILSLPKAGGEPTELAMLPAAPQVRLDGRADFLVEGDTAFYKTAPGLLSGSEPVSYYRVDLTTGTATLLASSSTVRTGLIGKSGDYLYTAVRDPSLPPASSSNPAPERSVLYRIPIAGGDPESVATQLGNPARDFSFGVVGADPESVLVSAIALPNSGTDTSQIALSGVYRIGLADGVGEQLFRSISLFNLQIEHSLVGDQNYLRSLESTDKFYRAEVGSSSVETLFCLDEAVHASAVDGQHYYVGIFDDAGKLSSIYRRAL